MKITEFFQGLRSKTQLNDALEKIRLLERCIEELEQKVDSYTDRSEQQHEPIEQPHEPFQPPIVVEKLHIEKITIDKFELSNNFGALGIKDLQGKLNIGANYGEGFPFSRTSSSESAEDTPDPSEAPEQEEKDKNSQESGPRYTINSKDI